MLKLRAVLRCMLPMTSLQSRCLTPALSTAASTACCPVQVVFGKLVDGLSVLRQMEKVATGPNDRPRHPVTITGCGELGADEAGAGAAGVGAAPVAREEEHRVVIQTTRDLMGNGLDRRQLVGAMAEEGLPVAFGRNVAGQKRKADATGAAGPEGEGEDGAKQGVGQSAHSDNAAMESAVASAIKDDLAKKGIVASSSAKSGVRPGGLSSVFGRYAVMGQQQQQRASSSSMLNHGLDGDGSDSDEEKQQIPAAGAGSHTSGSGVAAEQAVDNSAEADIAPAASDGNGGDTSADGDGAGTASGSTGDPLKDRLFALRLRLNAGRRDNHKEVVLEHKRIVDPAAEKRERWAAIQAEKAAEQRNKGDRDNVHGDAEDEGRSCEGAAKRPRGSAPNEDGTNPDAAKPAPYLSEPAALAEHKQSLEHDKERRKLMSYGWNINSSENQVRVYEKRVARLPSAAGAGTGYSAAAANDIVASLPPGQALDAASSSASVAGTLGYGQGEYSDVDPAGVERLVAEMAETDARRAKFHRRRATDAGDIHHISEANRRWNAGVGKAFDPYSVEVKQSLERGTAT